MADRSLRVSDNKRFLIRPDGSPFFYLADTAWELFHRCDRGEADFFLTDRAKKGFTVIQAVALAERNGLRDPNPYGHLPLENEDPTRPVEAYFQHLDYVVDKANSLGMFVGLLPTWGDKFNNRKWGIGPEVFTPANARTYGQFLGRRYRDRDVIWIVGGDRPLDTDVHADIIRAMAEGLRAGDGGRHLITFHPSGGETSARYVHAEPWLDFHMIQSGHIRDRANYDMIDRDYRLLPTRPCMDAEPGYEDHPNSFNPDRGWLDQHDVRKSLYWCLFAGGHGYTYGCHDIWQFWQPGRDPINWARTPWKDAVHLPASGQVQHARWLLESRPYTTRIPDQSLLKSDNGRPEDHVRCTRDADGSYAMVYVPSSQRVKVDLTKVGKPGGKVAAWWYNPRTGEPSRAGELDNAAPAEFYTPNTDQTGRDWVLVLDDAVKHFPPPGTLK
jgi:hypothetical protein